MRRLFSSPRLVLLIATLGVAQLLLFVRDRAARHRQRAASSRCRSRAAGIRRARSWCFHASCSCSSSRRSPSSALALFMTRTKLRSGGAGLGVEPRHRPHLRHQRQAHVDHRVDHRRRVRRPHRHLDRPAPGHHPGQHRPRRRRRPSVPRCSCAPSSSASSPACARCRHASSAGIAVGIVEAIVRANVASERPVDRRHLPLHRHARARPVRRAQRSRRGGLVARRPGASRYPSGCGSLWYVRRLPRIGFVLLFGSLGAPAALPHAASQEFLWTDVLIFAMAALPISMLTGWAGQLSLGQFAFVGLGGAHDGRAAQRPRHSCAVRPRSTCQFELPWLVAVVDRDRGRRVAALADRRCPRCASAGCSSPSSRFAFAVAASSWLFRQPVFTGRSSAPPRRHSEPSERVRDRLLATAGASTTSCFAPCS